MILVVDDSKDIRELLAHFIGMVGHGVRTAANGKEALELLHSGLRPCLIILDLMMPVMDGWQTEAELAKDPELAKIPTVIVTAFPEQSSDLERQCEQMQKPINLAKLQKIIGRYCSPDQML